MRPEKDSAEIYLKKYLWVILLVVVLASGSYVRFWAGDLPAADVLAKEQVKKHYSDLISQDVLVNYAYLLPKEQQKLFDKNLDRQMSLPKTKEEIASQAKMIRDLYESPANNKYLYGYDPYFYLRQAESIALDGEISDRVNGDVQWDDHRNAPTGLPASGTFMPYLLAWVSRYLSGGNTVITLAFYFPIVLWCLSAIALFALVRIISGSDLAAFFSGIYFACVAAAFEATKAGFFDTNPLILFFSTMMVLLTSSIVWLITQDKCKARFVKIAVSSVLALSILYLFRITWAGYYYIVPFCVAYLLLAILFCTKKRNIKGLLIPSAASLLVVICGVLIAWRVGVFRAVSVKLRLSPETGLYPQVYSTITELQRISFLDAARLLGGKVIFTTAMIFCIWMLIRSFRDKQWSAFSKTSNLFVCVWFIIMFSLSLITQKFIQYTSLAFAAVIGIGLSLWLPVLIDWLMSIHLGFQKQLQYILPTLFAILILVGCKGSLTEQAIVLPAMDDGFYDAADLILGASSEDAVIFSWWDIGYFLQYYADRGTIVDGGRFPGDKLFWLSRAFLSSDENKSRGIFKMLSCQGSFRLDNMINRFGPEDGLRYTELLLASSDINKTAEEIGINIDQAKAISDSFSCDSPEGYVVISQYMARKLNSINEYSDWDFGKAMYQKAILGMDENSAITYLADQMNISIARANNIYYNELGGNQAIDDEPLLRQFTTYCGYDKDNDIIQCGKSIQIDVVNKAAIDASNKRWSYRMHIPSLNFTSSGDVPGSDVIIIYEENGRLRFATAKPEIADSMFIRLYYFDAYNLNDFGHIGSYTYSNTKKPKVFKVIW